MNTKRSYLDQLNQGRFRRSDNALDDLSRSLAELEQRLDQHARGDMTPPTTRQGMLRMSASPVSLSSKATGPQDRDWADRLSGDFATRIGQLRTDIGNLGDAVANSTSHALKADFDRIAAAVEALSGKDADKALGSLQRDVEAVSKQLGKVARQDTLTELDKRWSDLEKHMSAQTAETGSTERLYERMEEIAAAISRIPQNVDLQGMEEKLHTLATAVDHFARHQDLAAPSTVSLLDERLDEISRAIAASGRGPGFDARPLDRIEAQMADLSRQLQDVSSEGSVSIFARINELLDRVDHLARQAAWPQDTVTALSQQLERIGLKLDQGGASPELATHVVEGIAERIDALAGGIERERMRSDEMMSAFASNVHDRFDALSEQLDQRGHDYALPEALDNRLNELAARLDRFAPSDNVEMLETVEARLRDVLARLDEQESTQASAVDTGLLQSLHQQIALLSERINSGEDVMPRLEALERFQETSGDIAIEAARLAAESVARSATMPAQDAEAFSGLAGGLRSLEETAREAEARNAKTFEVIHTTLMKIADRLSDNGKEVSAPVPAVPVEEPIEARMRKVLKQNEPLPEFEVDAASLPAGNPVVEPVISANEPIEPGSGTPNLNAIMRRVREDSARDAQGTSPDTARADFIAAARRAAQAAAADSDILHRNTEKSEGGLFNLSKLFRGRKKTMLLATTGILVALAGAQLTTALVVENSSGPKVAFAMPTQLDEQSAPTQAIAAADIEEPAVEAGQQVALAAERMQGYTPPVQQDVAQAPVAASNNAGSAIDTTTVASIEVIKIPDDAGPAALRQAAEKGDASALYEIGSRYAEGQSGTPDDALALQWFTKAADAGFALAQYRVGNAYEKGIGTDRDLDAARAAYEKAALNGNASAMHNLAVLNAMGTDGKTDNRAAVRWFREAADRGIKDSQFNMGVLAAKGVGMDQSLEESYQWFDIVARTGDKDAARKRDEIAKSMRPEELDRAKGRAQLWKQKPLNAAANEFTAPEAWGVDAAATTASIDAPVDMKKAISNVQKILLKNGYDAGTPDGVMGDRTKKALSAFQKDSGLQITGEISPQVIQALLAKNG